MKHGRELVTGHPHLQLTLSRTSGATQTAFCHFVQWQNAVSNMIKSLKIDEYTHLIAWGGRNK